MLTICSSNLDSMSFARAFRAARAETGSNGIFFWRGEPFHTLKADEKTALLPEEWDAYSHVIQDTLTSYMTALQPVLEPSDFIMQPDPLVGPGAEPVFHNFFTPATTSTFEWNDLFSNWAD